MNSAEFTILNDSIGRRLTAAGVICSTDNWHTEAHKRGAAMAGVRLVREAKEAYLAAQAIDRFNRTAAAPIRNHYWALYVRLREILGKPRVWKAR